LIGSGPWRRTAYLKEEMQLDDAEVRHFSPHDFGSPALAGCTARLSDALHAFCRWFENEPRTGWLTNASTKHWLGHHRQLLDKVTNIFFHADLILRRSTECGEDQKQEMAAFGLGTLFSEHWAARDGADVADQMPLPKPALLAEIRRLYAPVREAYRQWFVLFRQASTDEKRRLVRWTYEPTPEWALTLDAALTRGSLRLETLLEIPGAHWLRDDFRSPWEPCEECIWYLEKGYLFHRGPQDVLIEGDEEHAESLRITWWPMPQRRDRVIAIRVPRDALIEWWQQRPPQNMPSPFEEMQAFAASRPIQPEQWSNFSELLSRVAQPPRFDAERIKLPPYTEDDIRDVFLQRMQGRPAKDWPGVRDGMPEMVWAYDGELRFIPLLVGRDVHPLSAWSPLHTPTEKVIFPAAWPATLVGRGPFYLVWSQGHWREEKAEGLDFRRYNWLLPVIRQVPVIEGGDTVLCSRWGLIDIEGRFVLPCQFPAMSFPQPRGLGKPVLSEIPLPSGRREPWCWLWVGEVEHADGCWLSRDDLANGNIIEAWSGANPVPEGLTAKRLDGHFAFVSHTYASNDAPIGLFNLATGRCGPIRWRYIDTFYLSICHTGPAKCFENGLWTYVDESGEALLPAEFARTDRIDSGLATVQLGLAQADTLGLTLPLSDGSQQGPVGVFGPKGVDSLGQWFLRPEWRDVLGEYDGHFVVQNLAGDWGMVTPEGESVTRFMPRRERDEINGDILHIVIEQFKRVQSRRFLDWIREASRAGSLSMMAGKLRSSFGKYDYGALSHGEIPVRLLREVTPAEGSGGPEEMLNTPLAAGSLFAWRPAQRNYFSSIDLRTHCAIGPRSADGGESGYHGIHVPWDALALDLPALDFRDDAEQRQCKCLMGAEHLSAANQLIDELANFIDLLDGESASTYSPELQASTKLYRYLMYLLRLGTLHQSRGYREMAMSYLDHDLPEIDFPHLLTEKPENLAENRGDNCPEPQTAWSQKVRDAHRQACIAYRAWETVCQRCIGSYSIKDSKMNRESFMSLTIGDLEAKDEPELRQNWAEIRDFCNDIDRPRSLWRKEDVRDGDYYHLRMLQAIALLILLGKWKWQSFSMSDAAGPMLEYFKRANQAPLNGNEPRQFLEYLLAFKRENGALENDIDSLLTKIVDSCPDLGKHNFRDDPEWYAYFRRFAKGLLHRSEVYFHGKPIDNFVLAGKLKDLYYDELARLLDRLAWGINADAASDGERGRRMLSEALHEAADHLKNASESLNRAWSHCRPYVDLERKRCGLEHVFDAEEVKAAQIGQFVRSYLLTMRMHGESDPDSHYLSLLEGYNYHEQLASDPNYEAKIDALIEGLELMTGEEVTVLEREINSLIGRDVWTRQSFSNEG
jgi:hypothetical protein